MLKSACTANEFMVQSFARVFSGIQLQNVKQYVYYVVLIIIKSKSIKRREIHLFFLQLDFLNQRM